MSVYYWERALAALERKSAKLTAEVVPEDDSSALWKEADRLAWLERFARAARNAEEDLASI